MLSLVLPSLASAGHTWAHVNLALFPKIPRKSRLGGTIQPCSLPRPCPTETRQPTSFLSLQSPRTVRSSCYTVFERINLIWGCSDIPPLNVLLQSANALLASTVRWPPGKTYYDGIVQTFSHKEPSGPNWHGRLRRAIP